MMYRKENEAFSGRLVNGMNCEVEERRQGHHQKEKTAREGGKQQQFLLLLSNSLIWSPLLSLFSFNLQPNSLFHYQDNAGYYLFIARNIMMDVFQSAPALIRSVWTLAQSVSTPLIITHDCCDFVPTQRQLELCLRTISSREMERGREIAGNVGMKRKDVKMRTNARMQGKMVTENKFRLHSRADHSQFPFAALMWFLQAGQSDEIETQNNKETQWDARKNAGDCPLLGEREQGARTNHQKVLGYKETYTDGWNCKVP